MARRRPNADELTRLAQAEEDIRKLKEQAFGAGGSGGATALTWFNLTDIWTPDPGIAPNPFGYQPSCRFAADADFFHLSCRVLLGGAFTVGTLDESSKPTYSLGSIADAALEPWLPSAIAEDQSWGMTTSVNPVYADQGTAAGVFITLPHGSSGGTFAVVFDVAGTSAVGSAIEFHAALPWMPGLF